MGKTNSRTLRYLLGAFLVVASGLRTPGVVFAQYSVQGTTPGGGKIISGSGNLGVLSPTSTPVSLSSGGFDQVTLQPGSSATASGMDAIAFKTPTNTFVNQGSVTVTGSANALSMVLTGASQSLSGATINNFGTLSASNPGSFSLFVGDGALLSSPGLTSVALNNSGTISGDNAGVVVAVPNLTGLTINNNGGILGGSSLGAGLAVQTNTGSQLAINNTNRIAGGSGVDAVGIFVDAMTSLQNATIINSGTITGGTNSGPGVQVFAGDFASFTLNNSGTISATAAMSNAVDLEISGALTNSSIINSGTIAGAAGAQAGLFVDSGTINGLLVQNSGTLMAGPGEGGGLGIEGAGPVANLTVNNSGQIFGSNASGPAVVIDSGINLSGMVLNNTGTITGGAGSAGNPGGNAVQILAPVASNLVINNTGMITGGAAGVGVGTVGGAAISANSGNLIINNWGGITTGASGTPGSQAVNVTFTNNNTMNLNGHSTVNGVLSAGGNNNTNNNLNFNFSGLSPAAAAALFTSLSPFLNGQPSTGSVVVRGDTITWDPWIVHLSLSSYQLAGITPNQQTIGATLDGLATNPVPGSSLATLLNAIDQSGAVPQALEALSPQRYQIYGDIARADANRVSLEIDRRLNDRTRSAEKSGRTTAETGQDGGVFVSGYGNFGSVDGRGGDLSDARFNGSGLMLGVDRQITSKLVTGALLNYSHTDASLDNFGSSAGVDSYGGGVYAGYRNDRWHSAAVLTYDRNDYDSGRRIVIPGFFQLADGSTRGNQIAADISGGYDYALGSQWTLGPTVGLQYVHLGVDGFSESGAGAASLNIDGQSMDSFRSRVGVAARYSGGQTAGTPFTLSMQAAWQHQFSDDSRGINASFETGGLTPFTVMTTDPKRDALLAGVGVTIAGKNLDTFFRYDVQGLDSTTEQYATGGVKFSF